MIDRTQLDAHFQAIANEMTSLNDAIVAADGDIADIKLRLSKLETIAVPTPIPAPLPTTYTPPDSDPNYTVLASSDTGVVFNPMLFGMTVNNAGQSYATDATTPPPSIMPFRLSRQFLTWWRAEQSAGKYDFTCPRMVGQNMLARAQWFYQNGIAWVGVVDVGNHPPFYAGPVRGGVIDAVSYKNYVKEVIRVFRPLGMFAIEMANEPESGSWYGSAGIPPVGAGPVRAAARDLRIWVKHTYDAIKETGSVVFLWGPGCQSMAQADPASGLAAMFCDPNVALPVTKQYGESFLSDATGNVMDYLDKFSWHGYTAPAADLTLNRMLPAHYNKAGNWLRTAGFPWKMAVTEHGVVSTNDLPRWKQLLTDQQRVRWLLNAMAFSVMYQTPVIWYSWDETHMGLFGSGLPTPNIDAIALRYRALRSKLAEPGMRVFQLREGKTDGQWSLLLGKDMSSAQPYALD